MLISRLCSTRSRNRYHRCLEGYQNRNARSCRVRLRCRCLNRCWRSSRWWRRSKRGRRRRQTARDRPFGHCGESGDIGFAHSRRACPRSSSSPLLPASPRGRCRSRFARAEQDTRQYRSRWRRDWSSAGRWRHEQLLGCSDF